MYVHTCDPNTGMIELEVEGSATDIIEDNSSFEFDPENSRTDDDSAHILQSRVGSHDTLNTGLGEGQGGSRPGSARDAVGEGAGRDPREHESRGENENNAQENNGNSESVDTSADQGGEGAIVTHDGRSDVDSIPSNVRDEVESHEERVIDEIPESTVAGRTHTHAYKPIGRGEDEVVDGAGGDDARLVNQVGGGNKAGANVGQKSSPSNTNTVSYVALRQGRGADEPEEKSAEYDEKTEEADAAMDSRMIHFPRD